MAHVLISDNPLYKDWIHQFNNPKDRALASQLFFKLKLVSEREFETGIETTVIELQKKLGKTLAVYPVIPKKPDEISGYDQFSGGIPKIIRADDIFIRGEGKRKKYGSEDRVGHLLTKLQKRYEGTNGLSTIQCIPTIKQIKAEKIEHIVFIDDMCGSGQRIINYWKYTVSKSIKSLLSLKKLELWIVFYSATTVGEKSIKKHIPNFPIDTHLITLLPEYNIKTLLNDELKSLALNYSKIINMEGAGLGYRQSGGLVVFEHGCPNNVPAIFWASNKRWKGIFPNCSIPVEIKSNFDEENFLQPLESLWSSNQKILAFNLLEKIEQKNLSIDDTHILAMIGLLLKGVSSSKVGEYLLISIDQKDKLFSLSEGYGLVLENKVTSFGKELVDKYRKNYRHSNKEIVFENKSDTYYPSQCEGNIRFSGKSSEVVGG